eukprot:CAMPEP_0181322734 /NCGR_PEP_ID=MMETSP1101-20121128/19389_1 /TAXON_ID=46948 /ORGANISM="Rhodomonas abbreviata, Strain Caron Lab Isolate" /LENGTH=133 /DNA_ID=CAMNT_0023430673 /DNA_START=8 /DNA_END=409 /DNA_ORIENTATION=+
MADKKPEAKPETSNEEAGTQQAKSLEEGLEAAQKYDGDPLECPCIAHMKEGPCGDKFIVAYKCFLDSKEEEKGSDCLDSFREMQQCFAENPEHYKEFLGGNDEEEDGEEEDEAAKEEARQEQEWYEWNFGKKQ